MKDKPPDTRDIVELCRTAVHGEARALARFADGMGEEIAAALDLLGAAQAPIVVAGVGKSGHVARKIASTFSSIGCPALFLHAAEASHGDLGLVARDTAALVLSNSGETPELSDLMFFCEAHAIPTIAITGRAEALWQGAQA